MSDDDVDLLERAFERIRDLEDGQARMEARHERMFRYGKILDVSDIDLSDPSNPVVRIQHGKDAKGEPVKGPFVRYATWAGDRNQHTPPSVGQQFLHISPDGVFEAGLLVPLGHQTAIPSPETDGQTHVDEFGKVKRTLKKDSLTHTVGGVQLHTDTKGHKVTAPGQIVHAAGDPAAANSAGAGGLVNFPHELNRILQGVLGRLAQHDHHITALHDQASTIVDLAVPKVPALMQLQSTTLDHTSDGLKKAADQVVGKLPDFVSKAMTGALDKLTTSPLGLVQEIVSGDIAGQLGGLLDRAEAAIAGGGLDAATSALVADVMGQARLAVPAAAAGGNFDLGGALASLGGLTAGLAGTPAGAALAAVQGELQSVMGSTATLMSGLSGLLDGQVNAVKGTIKSYLLGGYA